ncbi:aromatic-ring-hydroxylating dioxygenase subunit beta [Novosphingobium sp. SG707]|uniref:aromatic-ring-hydroxylating dioxygenase subunit beta n=1 Tax=Novosphingobium sp. SG707 TaxID=2586996 RepID=UPI0014467A22|nr:aromatic-ring-hydroxylating dioxygenase subunit beta [Novosphingobium sp. SG707]NKJ00931.1 3-phenylpropionate/cinnamic acid dioxygenase small subunit [Novosphingobium sp. SG707]
MSAITPEIDIAIRQFLGYEAMLLDTGRLEDWAGLLDEAILYEIPMRISARKREDEFPAGAFRMHEDMAMIQKRLERMRTNENWAEDPASRTVRTVGSVFIEADEGGGVYRVHSALTLYRQRAIDRAYEWIPARRTDRIRIAADGECRLMRRTVILAETILQTPNLAVFL